MLFLVIMIVIIEQAHWIHTSVHLLYDDLCTKITGDSAVKRGKNGVELLKIEKMIPFDINF